MTNKKNISKNLKRKGTSSILGVIIFIGILFSSFLPLQLVMQQADDMKDREKHEVEVLDLNRATEDLDIFPLPGLIEGFNITLKNNCEIAISVNCIWVNDSMIFVNENIPAMGGIKLGPYPLTPKNGESYDIRVTTDRGNVFTSSLGVLFYIDGKWHSETLGIRLIFPSRPGRGLRGNDWLNELRVTIMENDDILYANTTIYWAISASEMFFRLEAAGDYRVIVYTLAQNRGQYWKKIYDHEHSITWPFGPPIVELKFKISGDLLTLT